MEPEEGAVPLQDQLSQLQLSFAPRRVQLQERIEEISAGQSELAQQLTELEQRIRALDAEKRAVEAELTELIQEQRTREFDFAKVALEQSSQNIEHFLEIVAQRDEISKVRQSLLAANPKLAADLQKFRAFSERLQADRERLDPLYLEPLETFFGKEKERLAPILQLDDKMATLPRETVLTINLVMSEKADGIVLLALPFPIDRGSLPSRKEAFIEACIKSLGDLGDVHSTDNEIGWQSFVAVEVLLNQPMEASIANLASSLPGLPTLADSTRDVQVAAEPLILAPEVWGLAQLAAAASETVVGPAAELDELAQRVEIAQELQQSLREMSGRWYDDEDIRSWELSARNREHPHWTSQASRLRTLLIRMLGKGYVGNVTANKDTLWQPLPDPHREFMRLGLEQLLAKSVLHSPIHENDNLQRVSIDPTHLGEIEALINHKITEFWSGIIAEEA